jgi:hypothetical protein
MTRVTAMATVVLLTLATSAHSQEHAHPGTAEQLGSVHFPTSCRPQVGAQFDRGVALLHSFEFGGSIRTFNDVLAVDSTCAMAYWGIALAVGSIQWRPDSHAAQ